jgi:YARHG domain
VEVRNWIYKENGYCFKTPKAIKAFGNAGCLYADAAQVLLDKVEA